MKASETVLANGLVPRKASGELDVEAMSGEVEVEVVEERRRHENGNGWQNRESFTGRDDKERSLSRPELLLGARSITSCSS